MELYPLKIETKKNEKLNCFPLLVVSGVTLHQRN
jgi:hypothetical protein